MNLGNLNYAKNFFTSRINPSNKDNLADNKLPINKNHVMNTILNNNQNGGNKILNIKITSPKNTFYKYHQNRPLSEDAKSPKNKLQLSITSQVYFIFKIKFKRIFFKQK